MKNNLHGLSLIVPVYNEEAAITATLKRAFASLASVPVPSEIIVVNDGSTDRTGELLSGFGQTKIVNHPVNVGYGNSIKSGLSVARYDWVGIVDADGSYPIEDIPRLIAEMGKGYDMVVGVRSNIGKLDGPIKHGFRTLMQASVRFLNDSRIEDPNSGFRLVRRDVAIRLAPFLCGTFSFTTSLTILTSGLNYFICYVPVMYSRRLGKSKVRHVRDSLRTLQFIAQGIIFFNPIKFFILLILSLLMFVMVPSLLLKIWRLDSFAIIHAVCGSAVVVLAGLGGLGDIIRISTQRKSQEIDENRFVVRDPGRNSSI